MSIIQDLYTVQVYKEKLSLDNKKMADYCLSMAKKDKGRVLSNVGGWQSNDLQGNHKPLYDLFVEIINHSNQFGKHLQFKHGLNISNIWVNINGFKDTNKVHLHQHCMLSGVYYIQTPKDCGVIEFRHPGFDVVNYDWNENTIKEFNNTNSTEWWLPVKAGNLYIFPSWLSHLVKPNLNKKEKRISISFNMVKNVSK